jgi:hypothetical protein
MKTLASVSTSTRITSTDVFDEVDGNVAAKNGGVDVVRSVRQQLHNNAEPSVVNSNNGLTISHVRSKSAPAINHKNAIARRHGQHDDQVAIQLIKFTFVTQS